MRFENASSGSSIKSFSKKVVQDMSDGELDESELDSTIINIEQQNTPGISLNPTFILPTLTTQDDYGSTVSAKCSNYN